MNKPASLTAEWNWRPAAEAPRDHLALAVLVRLKCCHPGARAVAVASRIAGRWAIDIGHDVEIEMFIELPPAPAPEAMQTGRTH